MPGCEHLPSPCFLENLHRFGLAKIQTGLCPHLVQIFEILLYSKWFSTLEFLYLLTAYHIHWFRKRCTNNPWCLVDLKGDAGKEKARPTDQPREPSTPVGLQNTANTCWINSALQALFHLPVFRYCTVAVKNCVCLYQE